MDMFLNLMIKMIMIKKKLLTHEMERNEYFGDCCSTYLESHGIILKGEYGNKSFKHNSYIRAFPIDKSQSNKILETSNKSHVLSIEEVVYKNKRFIFASGSDYYLDIFELKNLKYNEVQSGSFFSPNLKSQ